ncbi:MAG: TIGR00266 family protein [Flavobacteriaceae bacterium]
MTSHEIDYTIYGEEMQYVEIELDPQEAVVAEAGSFMMMDNGIKMDTIFGDGSGQDESVLGKIFSAGKRILTGESLFMTAFLNIDQGKRKVSFASPYPGKIIPVDLTEFNRKFICQKDAFLCAAKGVSIGIEFSKKLGRGLFGGEGFIMQKLEGDGMAFMHAGGTIAKKQLQYGEVLKVDTGCIVGFSQTVDYDIEFVGGIKNTIFGGEGLFFATLRGPGTVYIQSLPFSRLAGRVIASAPQTGSKQKGEGSILGGLGNILDGDNRF